VISQVDASIAGGNFSVKVRWTCGEVGSVENVNGGLAHHSIKATEAAPLRELQRLGDDALNLLRFWLFWLIPKI